MSATQARSSASQLGIPSWKRALDIACILLSLPVVLPVGLLIGFYIKLVSPGPVLFKQQRIGYRGSRFMCLKFRSMHVNAETGTHKNYFGDLVNSNRPMQKLDDGGDRRVIPGFKLIRALGLDELPQLINVLNGEMSLVGPRPSVVYEYEMFQPRHRERCNTVPGLTGLWQVSGKNNTTFEEMIDLDLRYIREMSMSKDVWIIARTIPALMVQAYESKVKRRRQGSVIISAGRSHSTGRGTEFIKKSAVGRV
jgi:lipopolysaccharide/colanic/teichoic acid biosynthesis glycosyltransferase